MNTHQIGVLRADAPVNPQLQQALDQDNRAHGVLLDSGARIPEGLGGIVVDVPMNQRFEAICSVAEKCDVPILTHMPVGDTRLKCHEIARRFGRERILSLDPMAFLTPIRKMKEHIAQDADPIQTLFTTWRLPLNSSWKQEFVQLIGLVSALISSPPDRSDTHTRANPDMLLTLLTHEDGAFASIEIGNHLPHSSPQVPELLIECFSRNFAYQCRPLEQVISLIGEKPSSIPWTSNPWQHVVSTFFDMIVDGHGASRGPLDDANVLQTCEMIMDSRAQATELQSMFQHAHNGRDD